MLVSLTRCSPLCLLIFLLVLPSSFIFTMTTKERRLSCNKAYLASDENKSFFIAIIIL